MRITYVGFGDFHHHAGMKQLYHFAQEICKLGHEAQILIAGSAETISAMEDSPLAEIVEIRFTGPVLTRAVRNRVQKFRPDLLHVWTPRHVPALVGLQLHLLTGASTIVDHEDDEDYHLRYARNSWIANWRTGARRLAIPAIYVRNTILPWLTPLSKTGSARLAAKDATTHRLLMSIAVAHTAISANLVASIKRETPTRSVHLLYPGANRDAFGPRARDADLEAQFGLAHNFVLAYSGTLSLRIFVWFMEVLRLITSQRNDVKLLLIGEDSFRPAAERIARKMGMESFFQLIGQKPYAQVPRYLSLADILVQHPIDQANHLRLPAKLPEYLATGKPVVTFATGIGESLEDGVHVRKLYTEEAAEAAKVVSELLNDLDQRESLGRSARRLCEELFDWTKNGRKLLAIYQSLLDTEK